MTDIFYVYEHWRPDKDVCFYVGKGTGKRANQMNRRSQHHQRIQAKLKRLGMCVEVRLVADGLSETIAFAIERERIAFWRAIGVGLANVTDGGDGVSGYRHGPEQKAKLSVAHKGRKQDPAWVEKRMGVHRGKKVSAETRRKWAESYRNNEAAFEANRERARAMGLSHKGKKRSAETRARMSEAARRAHKERPRSAEVRAKIGAAQKGVKRQSHTPETKAKMSAAAKAWRAARRAQRESTQPDSVE